MPLPEHPLRRLAHHRERLVQQPVQLLARFQALAERRGLRLQLVVGQRGNLRLQRVDGRTPLLQTIESTLVLRAEQGLGDGAEHICPRLVKSGRASWRESVCDEGLVTVVHVTVKKRTSKR